VAAIALLLVMTMHHQNTIANPPAPPPTVMAAVTEAPDESTAIVTPARPHRARRPVVRTAVQEAADPLVVHMFTDDPDVVIYWIANGKGNKANEEIIQ
jgi:hypothetical protein